MYYIFFDKMYKLRDICFLYVHFAVENNCNNYDNRLYRRKLMTEVYISITNVYTKFPNNRFINDMTWWLLYIIDCDRLTVEITNNMLSVYEQSDKHDFVDDIDKIFIINCFIDYFNKII